MEEKCYLCGHEATCENTRDTTARDVIIGCPNPNCCKREYRVSGMARQFYLEHEPEILKGKDKQKLIDWVKRQPEDQTPYLTIEVIEAVTGVRSQNIRYR